MKKFIFLAIFLIGLQVANAQRWISLFDGKTTTGWHTYLKPGQRSAWAVNNGALYIDTSAKEGRGDLVTDEEFDEFELKFQWKVAKGSNGGVIFFVQEDPKFGATYVTGPEFQVIDNVSYPDPLKPVQMAASLYDLIPFPTKFINQTGDWNSSRIRFKNKKLEFTVNGKTAISTTVGDDNWNNMVKASKFGELCCFAKTSKGRIALQDHGGGTSYRNIFIRKL
jgi:Domain of Unknown Function (DUF1080)